MQSWHFLIVWTVAAVLMGIFNGPVYARMLRNVPQEGETPEEARRRRRTGVVYVTSTIVAVIGGYVMIILVFPAVLGS